MKTLRARIILAAFFWGVGAAWAAEPADAFSAAEAKMRAELKTTDYGNQSYAIQELGRFRSARAVVALGDLLEDRPENTEPRTVTGIVCIQFFGSVSEIAVRTLVEMGLEGREYRDYRFQVGLDEEKVEWRAWWLANKAAYLAKAKSEVEGRASDPFTRPFAASSVWNRGIPDGVVYETVVGLDKIFGGINWNERWTTFVYKTTHRRSRGAKLFIHPPSLWKERHAGTVAATGNPEEVEARLRAASAAVNGFPANYYSTTVKSPPGTRTFPPDIVKIDAEWRDYIRVPDTEFSPSPDTDGHLAIWLPNGLVLEVYGAVVCKNGDVIGTMASLSDPTGDGSGRANGRCASLIPNYAGLIREGEVASGVIEHALACTFPSALLAPRAVFPALAFDMNDGYAGTVPMGALLALPQSVDVTALGLSPGGVVIARAAQRYGIYVVDRGGEGLTLKADQAAVDATTPEIREDLTRIVRALKLVPGGGSKARARGLPAGGGHGAEALADGFGDGDHLGGFGGGQEGLAVAVPQAEPGLEMLFFETQRDVAGGHAAAVERGTAGEAGPEASDFFQVRGPVFDVLGEDRADLVMLAHVGVEPA